MQKISVVIITYNEEKRIARCINSVKPFADEVVVVDSGSTDNTKSIAEELGAKFHEHNFEGYIEQKNYALGMASNDFIFSIDADEEVTDDLTRSILKVKNDSAQNGYSMNRLNIYCGQPIRHSGWYPDRKVRLFNRLHSRWGGINPHDRIETTSNTAAIQLKGDLLHYSYDSISSHVHQQNRFTDIAAQHLAQMGKTTSWFDLTLRPCWKFIRDYVINLGFADGYYGLVVCLISAHSVFLKYAKLRQLNTKA